MTAIREILFTFVGPGRVWIVARVDIDDGLRAAQVKALVQGIESGLKDNAEEVYRVDIAAIGGPGALPLSPSAIGPVHSGAHRRHVWWSR